MTHLVFCSYEVGGQPFRICEVLNRHGVPAQYVSVSRGARGHDSTVFHHGADTRPWDLSARVAGRPWAMARAMQRLRSLGPWQGVFATGSAAHWLARAGLRYSYWSYGADLDYAGRARLLLGLGRPWPARIVSALAQRLVRDPAMRRTLAAADAAMIGPHQREALQRLAPHLPLFFLPHFLPVASRGDVQAARMAAARNAPFGDRRVVFSAVRHAWSRVGPALPDYKGNDLAIRGFAAYLQRAAHADTMLVLVAKGRDVQASRRLVAELGIGANVQWVQEMTRADLAQLYHGASVCLGQFGPPVITGATIEPLACGTPVVAWVGEAGGPVPTYAEAPPVINTRSVDGIAQGLASMLDDPDAQAAGSQAAWSWAARNCSEAVFARAFARHFDERRAGTGARS